MKKALRMLCMGAMAAVSAVSFAQTDVTSKLLNADMERGVFGWDVTFEGSDIWKKTTKNQADQPGYHGCNNTCVEVWRYNSGPMSNNSISQTVKNLPNGTYVFGAYCMATNDEHADVRDVIEGVTLFANDEATRVATNRAQSMDTVWAHTARFNVAAAVTDGTLKVGMKVEETNTNFTLMDNATLYYFGDMELTAALNEMAKIDIAKTVAIADTCLRNKMNADTLAVLNEAIAAAKALTTDAEFYTADENLYWGIRLAVKSIKDYNKLSAAIAAAKKVAAQEDWSDYVAEELAALNALIAEADAAYAEANVIRQDIDTIVAELAENAAVVELDAIYVFLEEYTDKVDNMEISDEIGGYTFAMQEQAQDLLAEVDVVLAEIEEGLSAISAKELCMGIFEQVQTILDNPVVPTEFPVVIPRSTTTMIGEFNLLEGAVAKVNGSGQTYAVYTSNLYSFSEPLTKIRFTVKETGCNGLCGNFPFFHLGELELYDETGEKIELTVENLYTNACHNTLNNANDGLGLYGLVDGDPTTHFHSTFSKAVNEYHYIEVTLPEDKEYYGFSFVMMGRQNGQTFYNTRQFPAVLDIRYVSEAVNELKSVISELGELKPVQGTSVGFYNTDINVYFDAVNNAKAVADADFASDSEIAAAIKTLREAAATLAESFVLPDPKKEYRILSAVPFVEYQGVTKALTYRLEDNGIYRLWWETSCPDSLSQVFTFEPMVADEGQLIYAVKHVATGLFINDYVDADGNVTASNFGLSDVPGEVTLTSLEKGMFTIGQGPLAGYRGDVNTMHAGGHTSGKGEAGAVIKWNTEPLGTSQWYIRELTTLPYTATSTSDETFKTEDIHLYVGVNTITLVADKECAFENLVVRDYLGEVIPATVTKGASNAKVVLDVVAASTIAIEFDNAEGVSTVIVDGSLSEGSGLLTSLQDAYNTAVAKAVVEGDGVGQVSDLTAYNKALDTAEDLLIMGGTDAEIKQAISDLQAAVEALVYNLPVEGKSYYIVLGHDGFRQNHNLDMGFYQKNNLLNWTYLSIHNDAYKWQFVNYGEPVNDRPAYYIQNVATGHYISQRLENNGNLTMLESCEEQAPYDVQFLTNGKVSVGDTRWTNGDASLHPLSHNSGANLYGGAITWGKGDAASAMYIVETEKYISDLYDELSIENIDVTDEYVAPAVKGTFDLFGRRIETPAATGIYIIDGKKKVVKK